MQSRIWAGCDPTLRLPGTGLLTDGALTGKSVRDSVFGSAGGGAPAAQIVFCDRAARGAQAAHDLPRCGSADESGGAVLGNRTFKDEYLFGVQTNATLFDEGAIAFLAERNVNIGLSLDGPLAETTGATWLTFGGKSAHDKVLRAMESLRGYAVWSVIVTCTAKNLDQLVPLVGLFHAHEVPTSMPNAVRCPIDALGPVHSQVRRGTE